MLTSSFPNIQTVKKTRPQASTNKKHLTERSQKEISTKVVVEITSSHIVYSKILHQPTRQLASNSPLPLSQAWIFSLNKNTCSSSQIMHAIIIWVVVNYEIEAELVRVLAIATEEALAIVMLSVESVRSSKNEREEDGGRFLIGNDDDFGNGSLLDDINFDDLFVGIEDGDLPDLEMDPEMLAEFSSVEESDPVNVSSSSASGEFCKEEERKEKVGENLNQGEESVVTTTISSSGSERSRKPASSANTAQVKVGQQGKRKIKVDWTPELHRRFVQAVEQLGVDKAVPSRILELMGIDCLTRHNIASHLQKYRSHRKHLVAREAEAANWSQRRQLYGGGPGRGTVGKREMAPWLAPTIGFPPPAPIQPFRPLHVWGHPHPTIDQPMMHIWPKHLVRSPPPWMPPGAPPPPHPAAPNRPPYWLPHHQLGGSHFTQGTPYYPQQLTPTRFPAPPVPGIPQAMFKPEANVPVPAGQPDSRLQIDFNPSKETIDAALGDVLAKPWLPLPLGLKPPSIDSVVVELQRQGISKIPPSCS